MGHRSRNGKPPYWRKIQNDEGDATWLEFFKDTSKAFEIIEYLDKNGWKYIEKPSVDPSKLYLNILSLDKKLGALDKLLTFSDTVKFIDPSHRNYKYYIIEIDPKNKASRVFGYKANEYKRAIQNYSKMENDHLGTQVDQVFVSAGSLKNLQIAYPNYFIDIGEFVSKIKSLEKSVE